MNETNFTENRKDFGFDIVLPSHLVLNNSISSTTKLLYGLIRNLTRVEGYCYARNSYLAGCMGMKERRIQEMLSELEKHGYIEKELDDLNFNKTRKIFISNNFLKNISANKKVLTSCTKMHGGVHFSAPIKKIVLKKIKNPPLPPPKANPSESVSKEEEDEIQKRLKERPKKNGPVKHMKSWRKKVVESIREDNKQSEIVLETSERHQKEAIARDGTEDSRGCRITACREAVEFTLGSHYKAVRYDLDECEWRQNVPWPPESDCNV